jgi:hypothetical protein
VERIPIVAQYIFLGITFNFKLKISLETHILKEKLKKVEKTIKIVTF